MQSRGKQDLHNASTERDLEPAVDSELSILRDIFRMLPNGVAVQDEHGRFLLVNEAAAVQFGIAAGDAASLPSNELSQRRDNGVELLRAGRPAVAEECVTNGHVKQVFSHGPSAGSYCRPQSPALELGRHQRAEGVRGPPVSFRLL